MKAGKETKMIPTQAQWNEASDLTKMIWRNLLAMQEVPKRLWPKDCKLGLRK